MNITQKSVATTNERTIISENKYFLLPGTAFSNLHVYDISKWIISAIGGSESGRTIQNYLSKMIYAIESYFQPVNSDNQSAPILHAFINFLCENFLKRLHNERYNTKRTCKTPTEKRLTDSDVENFILGLKPVIFHMVFNEEFDSERHDVFNSLSTIRPDLIIPTLLKKFKNSMDTSMTEPHSFKACLATMRSCSRPSRWLKTIPWRSFRSSRLSFLALISMTSGRVPIFYS